MKGAKTGVSAGPAVAAIQRLAAGTFGVAVDRVTGRSCRRKVVRCRQAAIHVACGLTHAPKAEIARIFRKHRTLIGPTLARVAVLLGEDAAFADKVARIEAGSRRLLQAERNA